MFGLNIYLDSIKFKDELIDENSRIKVSVATVPDKNKQSILIDSRDLENIQNSFKINISEHLNEVLFVFWKENILQNTIIASTIIHVSQLPRKINDRKNHELLNVNIYEPIHFMSSDNNTIYGSMKIKLTLTQPFYRVNQNKKNTTLIPIKNDNRNHNIFTLYESILN